jgi:urea transport system permease protein
MSTNILSLQRWLPWALLFGLLAVLPLFADPFRVPLFGKYLAFAFVAVGIVLSWGYCGILSLGQGMFFGIGAYAAAMFLKLEASAPELPDFMVWSSVEQLPLWWEPFHSLAFTLLVILLLPVLLSFPLSYLIFRKRVSGVYFAILTLALALTLTVLIIGSQGGTGGANGITDFSTLAGIDVASDEARARWYYFELALLGSACAAVAYLVHSRYGKVLIAIRDREDRVRFSGYDTALYKAFTFAVASVLASIGGAMFVIFTGLITPQLVGAVASVELVIFAAFGGRLSVLGAVAGAFSIGWLKSILSETFPELWLFFLGGLFLVVTAVMPQGLAGVAEAIRARIMRRGEER